MRKIKITGRGLPKYQQQPGTFKVSQCLPGERYDETLGMCVPDMDSISSQTVTSSEPESYDFNGCIVGKEVWSVADQKCIPIEQQEPQKFNVNPMLSGTPGQRRSSNSSMGLMPNPSLMAAATSVGMLSNIADTLQESDRRRRIERSLRRFGATDTRFGPVRNVYSYGRTPTGFAYNQMVPVQFAGNPAFEAMTVPQFAQDGIEVTRDIMQLPTLYTSDPSAPGLYAENPAVLSAMNRRYADIELPTADFASAPAAAPVTSSLVGENFSLPLDVYSFTLTSGFGKRKSPTAGASSDHNGVDFGVKEGANVYSIKPGTVYKRWYDGRGGNQIIINHDDGTKSGYAHLKDFVANEGERVNAGSVIGYSGNTGNTTGPHLHFTYTDESGNKVDPMSVLGLSSFTKNSRPKNYMTGSSRSNSGEISYTHNNPLNIHYGGFAQRYGGAKGSVDAGGNVAMFPDLTTGIQAAKDLLFGPTYIDLTISEARNRWVNGNEDQFSSSTPNIVKAMGKDVKLSQLSASEREKLIKEFAKWEGKQAYKLIKDVPLYKEGGEYDLDDEEIQQILANGGQIEFL